MNFILPNNPRKRRNTDRPLLATGNRILTLVIAALLGGLLLGFTAVSCASAPRSAYPEGLSAKTALPADPAVLSGRLENGMAWKILRNGEPKNRIALRLAVNAGSILEAEDQRGIAHLVEHMAFNGSEHFAKNELIDYFESIGMAFGPEVNAYTSFDETVYMLEIPADDPQILEQSLLVLRDWAAGLSFDQEELDKERGVVIEEWRLGRGASGRANDKIFPFIFAGSLYSERLPIGDPEIVKTVSRERVVDFYRDWYRSDLMTVTLVGDADPSVLQAALEQSLGTIPRAKGKAGRPVPAGPKGGDPAVLVFTDPEIQYTTVEILEPSPSRVAKTLADLRASLVRSLAESAFNGRLTEKTLVADPVILGAGAGSQRLSRASDFAYLAMVPQPGKFREGMKELVTEWLRYRQFGITAGELDRARESVLDSVKQAWLDREKIPSSSISGSLVNEALYGDVRLSPDDELRYTEALLPLITKEEVDASIAKWFTDRGTALVVTANAAATDIPAEAELLDLWQNWKDETALVPYVEAGLERPLFDPELAAPETGVSVLSERKLTSEGLLEWRLSNGVTVLALPTDYKNNEVLFSAWSKGGTSLPSDADYPSAAVAASWAQMSGLNGYSAPDLQKKLSGMTVGASPWIGSSFEGLSGSSSVKDLETAFQLLNLYFTRPSFSGEAWGSLIAQLETVAAARKNDPAQAFEDLKSRLLYGDDLRHAPLTPELVALMDRGRSEKAYRERFAGAGDFTFVFVGSFDPDALKALALAYLGALPSPGTAEEARALDPPFPSGKVAETLKRGVDPKSRVFLAFGGPAEISGQDRELYGELCSLLEIRLREIIREDMSGSYGVSVRGSLQSYPAGRFETTIEFGCEPGREEELASAVFEQIRWMQGASIPEKYVTKLRENLKRAREENYRSNGWWLNRIMAFGTEGRDYTLMRDEGLILRDLTGDTLQALAKRWFNAENCVQAYLKPEN